MIMITSLNNALEINRAEHEKKSDDDDQVEFKKELLATQGSVMLKKQPLIITTSF